EIILRPFGALDRPFVLGTRHELLAGVTHLQPHLRLFRPAGILAVQKIVKEATLLLASVIGVEMRPMLDAVRLQPLLLGGCAREAFEIAARMQALAAPIGGREQRGLDFLPCWRPVAMILVVHRMGANLSAEIRAVFSELFLGQRVRTAHQLAMHGAASTALAKA